MRVLVTESDPGRIPEAVRELVDAGHDVVRCNEVGEPAFPCSALSDGGCPLDETTDVVLAVRAHPHPEPTASEAGVTCALRHGVPLVVTGTAGQSPFESWTEATVTDGDDLAAVLEEAAHRAPPDVVEAARTEARRLLGDDADVRVVRDGDRLAIELQSSDEPDDQRLRTVAVRVLATARAAGRHDGSMDVTLGGDGS